MTRIAVVIPYYQDRPGLLSRCLASVLAQDVDASIRVTVFVVDDSSPVDPALDIQSLRVARENVSIEVLRRPNGGPAAARNSGLDAATDADADFIAFLDSDDVWNARHLSVGVAALARGAQFYFANNEYESGRSWFDGLKVTADLLAASMPEGDGVYRIARENVLAFSLAEYIAHTSTVIFDARRIRGLRFDEEQRTAGEDHLFWMSAIELSDYASFSTQEMARRGRGMDLYRRALDWSNPECVRRLYFALMLNKKMLARFCRTEAQRANLRVHMNHLRRGILYLFMRNAFRHVRTNAWVFGQLLRTDAGFWSNLPRNGFVTITQKLSGKIDFPAG